MVVQVPIMLGLALFFALILDRGRCGWRGCSARIFVPYAVPTVVAALMWGYLYGQDFGPFADVADGSASRPRTSSARARCCARS